MSVCYSFGLFFSILFSTERPTISPLPCATMSRICPARRLRSFWMLCGFQRSRQGFCLSKTVWSLGDMFTAYRHYARKAKTGFARKQGLTPLKFFTYDGQGGGIHDIQTSALRETSSFSGRGHGHHAPGFGSSRWHKPGRILYGKPRYPAGDPCFLPQGRG